MIINLSRYDDLGKCTAFTLKKQWDTDKDKIYVVCRNFAGDTSKCEIPIESLDDLIPFLWVIPPIHTNTTLIYFSLNLTPWYERYRSISGKHYDELREKVLTELKEDNR